MADDKTTKLSERFAEVPPGMKDLKITQDKIQNILRDLEGSSRENVKSKIMDVLKGAGVTLGDLGASTTKLLNKFGIESPKQKLKKKKKDSTNVDIISAKAGKLIKCGAQIKGTSPLIRKRK